MNSIKQSRLSIAIVTVTAVSLLCLSALAGDIERVERFSVALGPVTTTAPVTSSVQQPRLPTHQQQRWQGIVPRCRSRATLGRTDLNAPWYRRWVVMAFGVWTAPRCPSWVQ